MDYSQFKAEWLGKRVDYDHVYAYQCVDLILEYIKECYGIPSGVWGNAIDYWNHPSTPLLDKFDKISTTTCVQGDIVILYGMPGNPYGHIGVCDHQDASGVWLLEQNKNGDATGLGGSAIGVYRAIPTSRIAGVLRSKSAPVPQPTPAPASSTVFLPPTDRSWNLYYVGSLLRPNTTDVKAVLAPYRFDGITYKIVSWVGDYAVVVDTQMFGRGVVWVKGTDAVIS